MGDKGKYIDEIGRQQGEWDDLGTDGQQEIKDSREQIEAGEADSSEAIREYIIQHNENKKNPAYLVRGAELICSQGTNKRMMNLSKCHGVYIKAHAAVHELDCVHTDEENITWFGVCNPGEGLETEDIELVADNGEKRHGKKCEPHIIGTWQESFEGTRIVDNGDKKKESGEDLEGCNTITMDSFLVCKHGGIIMPLSSGQDREVSADEFVYEEEEERKKALERVQEICGEEIDRDEGCEDLLHAKLRENEEGDVHGSEFENISDEEDVSDEEMVSEEETVPDGELPEVSKKALMALMELEVLNDYADNLGYLVIENGKLTGIKPHLAGDGGITVGFGDYLEDEDIKFYKEKGYELSTDINDFDKIKDMEIPTDICYEKMIKDVEPLRQSLQNQINDGDIKKMLSQQEMDALVIAKYQCFSLGEEIYPIINENQGWDELYQYILEQHGENGGFESRTEVETNIYFNEKYEVEGGLGDTVRVEAWESEE